MDVQTVDIKTLHLSPANPRNNDAAVDTIAASLNRFGWQQPIVARPDGEVIAGNTRLKAAKSLGMTHVPVVRFEGETIDAIAYQIADNRTSEFAGWDDAGLAPLLEELRNEDALEGVGFESDDIDRILNDVADCQLRQKVDGANFKEYETLDHQQARDGDAPAERCPTCGGPV